MARGNLIMFNHGEKACRFNVGIDDSSAAIKAATANFPGAKGIVVLPLKDGEFESLGLSDGEVREAS